MDGQRQHGIGWLYLLSIVGGLLVSQMLTLYTTPVVYIYLDRLRLWWARFGHRTARAPAV